MLKIFGAIDLGASSGRVIAGVLREKNVELVEIHRFANTPVEAEGSLYWNLEELKWQISRGLLSLARFAETHNTSVASLGIDSWAVDYGLLGSDGLIVEQPRHYRDKRNALGVAKVESLISDEDLFARNGLQHQPFNTLYQLVAHEIERPKSIERASTMLLMPDLLTYWLTGIASTERTNASTTGLLNAQTREWDWDLIERLGIRHELFTKLVDPGEKIGRLLPEHISHPALTDTIVTAVASHDTASAVAGAPLTSSKSAYLSSGTWSLLGAELNQPLLSNASRIENFTNELGVENTTRFLKNLSGLWLLQQCFEDFRSQQPDLQLDDLLRLASEKDVEARINVTSEDFLAPGDMPNRVVAHCRANHYELSNDPAEIVRCILNSLADAYADAISALENIVGFEIDRLHVVGGGSQNQLLCQLTADTTGKEVVAGPIEATALGNLMIQASSGGFIPKSLRDQRKLIAASFTPVSYHPRKK